MIKLYKEKSHTVEAVKFTRYNIGEIREIVGDYVGCSLGPDYARVYLYNVEDRVITIEEGDYIVKREGRIFALSSQVFDLLYEEVDESHECSECKHCRYDSEQENFYCRRSYNIISPDSSSCDDFELDD